MFSSNLVQLFFFNGPSTRLLVLKCATKFTYLVFDNTIDNNDDDDDDNKNNNHNHNHNNNNNNNNGDVVVIIIITTFCSNIEKLPVFKRKC